MKRFFLILFLNNALCIMHFGSCFAQNPLVKMWDKRFGGAGGDELSSIQQTSDAGFILGGRSISGISGNKTQVTMGYYDYWIVKIDSIGNKQLDKDFGGTSHDNFSSFQQTSDGGYILGGSSLSGIGGDKTEDSKGGFDYWIVKIDSSGNKQWDKDFGGTKADILSSIQQTSDGGYILGGSSYSDINVDKSQANWDSTNNSSDFWIIKTDSVGNKQWDKVYGGTDKEELSTVYQTNDAGFILGGYSLSKINGDKTQALWDTCTDVTCTRGDYWIVKTDSLGNKEWDKDFGGTRYDYLFSVRQTLDNGFLLGGVSYSGISGDKTQPLWGPGQQEDYWIIKTDGQGNKIWDKDFGGFYEDWGGKISLTSDGGYLIAGVSFSPVSGNKTEWNLGQKQTWILKINSVGNINWDKTLHTNGYDERGLAIEINDGCFLMANYTTAGIGGEKTEPNWDSNNYYSDYWIIKLCDSTHISVPEINRLSSSIVIYPNPATDLLTIDSKFVSNEQIKSLAFYNVLGEKIYSVVYHEHSSVNCEHFPSGIYWVEISSAEKTYRTKFIKQ